MSASFASVCHVASQLMKHCLGMEIFDCAVLVAEALVAYQKARLSRRAERLRQRQMFQRGIRGQELLAPRNETHDRVRIFFSLSTVITCILFVFVPVSHKVDDFSFS